MTLPSSSEVSSSSLRSGDTNGLDERDPQVGLRRHHAAEPEKLVLDVVKLALRVRCHHQRGDGKLLQRVG